MHISDGVLLPPAFIGGYAVSLTIIGLTVKKMKIEDMPKISVITAVFFIASLIHIPLGVTSVHLILNGLVGIVLGMSSFISIFIGLILQCLLFQHGGITSLGWNACMMGLPALGAHFIFSARKNRISSFLFETHVGNLIICFVASFVLVFSSVFCFCGTGVFVANKVAGPMWVVKAVGVESSFRSKAKEGGFNTEEIERVLKEKPEEVFSDPVDIANIWNLATTISFYRVVFWGVTFGCIAGIIFVITGLNMKDSTKVDPSWNFFLKLIYRLNHFSREYIFGFMAGSFAVFGAGIILAAGLAISGQDFIPVAKAAILAHVFIMIIEGIVVGSTAVFLTKIKPEILDGAKK